MLTPMSGAGRVRKRDACPARGRALIAEFVVQENTDLRERLTKGHVRMKDGALPIPDAPGLGLELNEEEVRKHRVA